MLYSIPTPFTLVTLPYLLIGALIEYVVIWFLIKRRVKNAVKILVAVLIGNLLTAFTGLFVVLSSSLISNVFWYVAMFLINVIIESSFYIAFFSRSEVSKWRIIWVTTLANLLTFMILGYGLFINTALTKKYLLMLKVPVV